MKAIKDMTWQERKALAYKRMYSGKRYIVYDYLPDRNGEYGAIDELPLHNGIGLDYGFMWKKDDKAPSVCIHHNRDYRFEVNCYWDEYTEDETWEKRTDRYWHIFTSVEKAQAYAEGVKNRMKDYSITMEDVVKVLKKMDDYKDACIGTGKRGYENTSEPYECIVAQHGWVTFKVIDNKLILAQFGQLGKYIIPHIDVLERALKPWMEGGHYVNYDFCESSCNWNDYYINGEY